jgi:hypothetical protein
MKIKTKILAFLIVIGIFDTITPIPILGLILLHVVLDRPKWFKSLVTEVDA